MSSTIEVTNEGDAKRKYRESSPVDANEPLKKKSTIGESEVLDPVANDNEPPKKKETITDSSRDPADQVTSIESIHNGLSDLSRLKLRQILRNDANHRLITAVADVQGSAQPAVIVLEKVPFQEAAVGSMLVEGTRLTQLFHNDVYGSYSGVLAAELNPIKVTLIHPATEKHIEKHSSCRMLMLDETPTLYHEALLPYVTEKRFNHEWVYNILEHRSEAERIVYEDSDEQSGFIILPDLKWDGVNLCNLYLIAIVRRRDLGSLRDLNASHLPLLRNIASSGIDAVTKRYGLHQCDIRAYLHYLPSYYHLHVHITAVNFDAPGHHVGRAHLLSTVINNIELMPDYYQRATLSYTVPEADPLVQYYRKAAVMTSVQLGPPPSDIRLYRAVLECRQRVGSAYLTCQFKLTSSAHRCHSPAYTVRVRSAGHLMVYDDLDQLLAQLNVPAAVRAGGVSSLKPGDYTVEGVWQTESKQISSCTDLGSDDVREDGGDIGCVNYWITVRLPLSSSALSGRVLPVDTATSMTKQWLPRVGSKFRVYCAHCWCKGGVSLSKEGAIVPVACVEVSRCLPLPTDNWEHAAADAFCCTGFATAPASAATRGRPGCASAGDVLTSTSVIMLSARCLRSDGVRVSVNGGSKDNNNIVCVGDKSNTSSDCVGDKSNNCSDCAGDKCVSSHSVDDVLCGVCGQWLGQLTTDGDSVRLWRHCVVWQLEAESVASNTEKKEEERETDQVSSVTAREMVWRLLIEHAEQAPTRVLITSCQRASPHGLLLQLLDKQQVELLSWSPQTAAKQLISCEDKCQQLVVMKLLYKEISDAHELRSLRRDFSVDLLSVDEKLWQVLVSQLQEANSCLPPDQRTVLDSTVGWLTEP